MMNKRFFSLIFVLLCCLFASQGVFAKKVTLQELKESLLRHRETIVNNADLLDRIEAGRVEMPAPAVGDLREMYAIAGQIVEELERTIAEIERLELEENQRVMVRVLAEHQQRNATLLFDEDEAAENRAAMQRALLQHQQLPLAGTYLPGQAPQVRTVLGALARARGGYLRGQ